MRRGKKNEGEKGAEWKGEEGKETKEKGKVLVSKRKEKEEGLDTKAEKKRNR